MFHPGENLPIWTFFFLHHQLSDWFWFEFQQRALSITLKKTRFSSCVLCIQQAKGFRGRQLGLCTRGEVILVGEGVTEGQLYLRVKLRVRPHESVNTGLVGYSLDIHSTGLVGYSYTRVLQFHDVNSTVHKSGCSVIIPDFPVICEMPFQYLLQGTHLFDFGFLFPCCLFLLFTYLNFWQRSKPDDPVAPR